MFPPQAHSNPRETKHQKFPAMFRLPTGGRHLRECFLLPPCRDDSQADRRAVAQNTGEHCGRYDKAHQGPRHRARVLGGIRSYYVGVHSGYEGRPCTRPTHTPRKCLGTGPPTQLLNPNTRNPYPASYGRDSAGITRAVRRLRYRAAGIPVHEKSNPTQQTGLRRVADSDPLPLR
jgi:hypothetical protein